jgi:Right handed beta helix region
MKQILTLITVSLLTLMIGIHAAEIYVATDGNDASPGTKKHPLQTIQAALDRLHAGDTCILRGGTYREAAVFKTSGEADKPVCLQAYPGESVVLDGTEAAPKAWTVYQGKIYKTPVAAEKTEQLFAGREMMIEARWPNMTFDQRFDRCRWAQVDKGSMHGKIVCEEIAKTGIDFTGAMACLNVAHQWWTWSRPITQHQARTNTLEYPADLKGLAFCDPALYKKIPAWVTKTWEDDYFYLYGKLELLDVETEWFHDSKTGLLYFYAPGGVDPSTLDVRFKARDYALKAKGQHHLEIKGINFFACSFRLDECDDCLIENCELLYPTYTRTITEYDTKKKESVLTKITGDRNVVRHCSLAYANNAGLEVMGSQNRVENCIIHDVNWMGTLEYPALKLGVKPHSANGRTNENSEVAAHGNVASHNTLYNGGNALLLYPAPDSVVEYNHVYDGGLACKDVSLIYAASPISRDSVVRYNWVHGCVTDDFYGRGGHGGIGIRADDYSRSNTVHHNVVWNCGEIGITLKGDGHLVYNNTVFGIGTTVTPWIDFIFPLNEEKKQPWYPHQFELVAKQNQHSEVVNNIGRNINMGHKVTDALKDSERIHHNLRGTDPTSLLMDPDHFDFRPKPGSALINAGIAIPGYTDGFKGKAPDLGAYESKGERWVPGAAWQESFTRLTSK